MSSAFVSSISSAAHLWLVSGTNQRKRQDLAAVLGSVVSIENLKNNNNNTCPSSTEKEISNGAIMVREADNSMAKVSTTARAGRVASMDAEAAIVADRTSMRRILEIAIERIGEQAAAAIKERVIAGLALRVRRGSQTSPDNCKGATSCSRPPNNIRCSSH